MPHQSPYLTVAEAAILFRVHPNTIYRWIKAGELPIHKRVGRKILIAPDAAAQFAAEYDLELGEQA